MSFDTWDNQVDCEESLAAINTALGCPYVAKNGYRKFGLPYYQMDRWAFSTKSVKLEQWGFASPQARLGKTKAQLDAVLRAGYTRHTKKPADWTNEDKI